MPQRAASRQRKGQWRRCPLRCPLILLKKSSWVRNVATYLNGLGVFPLPVPEVENLILLPEVRSAIAQLEGFGGAELDQQLTKLKAAIFATLQSQAAIADVVVRFCHAVLPTVQAI